MSFHVSYDQVHDVLYLAREGTEAESVEVAPGITLEYDAQGGVLGLEVLRASQVLRDVLKPLLAKAESG